MNIVIIFFLFQIPQLYCLNWHYEYFNNLIGKTVYIIDTNVNFREEANLNARIINRLQLHEEVILLEMGSYQEIDNMRFYWYKVRYNNIDGYVYGAYIADQRFYNNINGIEILLYTRTSYVSENDFCYFDPYKDFLVYIDRRRINIGNIFDRSEGNDYWKFMWLFCLAKTTNNGINLLLTRNVYYEAHDLEPSDKVYIFYEFVINKSGQITFEGIRRLLWEEAMELGYSK
jgi:hypothetical protein